MNFRPVKPTLLLCLRVAWALWWAGCTSCTSTPRALAPPPVVPGMPGQHWQLCLRLSEEAVREVVLSNPHLSQAFTPEQMACLRMRAARGCGRAFQKLAQKGPVVLVGQWCPPDFEEATERFENTRCGEDPDPLVDAALAEVAQSMALRIEQALAAASSKGGN